MIESELKRLKQQLLDMSKDLQEREEEYNVDTKPVELDQTKVGRLSRMDAMQVQQMALETSRRRQQQLVMIDHALSRIESDKYGYCLRCDEEIDLRRLFVNPTSTLCIKCADG